MAATPATPLSRSTPRISPARNATVSRPRRSRATGGPAMTPNYRGQRSELSWLLDDLVNRVAQVMKAVMLTQDGLAIGASAGLSREDAEHLAALAAGFQSMARGAGEHFGGGQGRQTVIGMEAACLFGS